MHAYYLGCTLGTSTAASDLQRRMQLQSACLVAQPTSHPGITSDAQPTIRQLSANFQRFSPGDVSSCVLQVIGLKYFDDMQHRIPRTEVEQVHSLVYGVVKEVLAVDGLPDADRLHCRVTGSYIRGKPMTGAALPAACIAFLEGRFWAIRLSTYSRG